MKAKELVLLLSAEIQKNPNVEVLFREPYDDADEFPIESVLVRKDAIIITP